MTDGIQIERSEHAQEFVIIGNAEARDSRLSFRARGLHHHLLSLPPGWRVTTAELAKEHPEGREAIRTALNELIEHRYVTKRKRQDAHGRWSTTLTVHDKPQPGAAADDLATEDGFPGVGQPDFGKPGAKDLKTVTEDGEDQKMASRHARASSASTRPDIPSIIAAVRAAAEQVYGQADADALSDEEALGVYWSKVRGNKTGNLAAYIAHIFTCAPSIDSILSNCEAVCVTCVQWETDCKCSAA